jgi:radical SAM superfamily enzyme YgiQ (UPF0313 family)
MRLILVDNLLYEESGGQPRYDLQPHLGLMSLAAVAREGGHEAQIYDPKRDLAQMRLRLDASLYRGMADRIAALAPDIVGFTALCCNFHCVVKVAGQLKQMLPGLPILLGGPHASILHQPILERFDVFDAVARHEAERTLLPLLAGIATAADLAEVPGISYRLPGGEIRCNPSAPSIEDLDQLPFPAYDCYPIDELGLKRINIEAGRGCPFSCTFCSTATFFGRNYRIKSARCLVDMMDRLNALYGFTDFGLQHDLFTVNRKKILGFCETVRDRNYRWGCSARVDCVDEELLLAMAGAGCSGIYFGIETGSPRMQRISRKRLDIGLVEPTLSRVRELDMRATASLITGYPEEEADDQAATLDFAGRLHMPPHTNVNVQLHLLTPEPGTALMEQYGTRLRFDGHISDFNLPMLEEDDATLLARNPDLFGNHHFFPTVLPRERHVFATSAWNALRGLGRDALRYLLKPYEGRLSRFVDELDAWRLQHAGPAAIDAATITAFVAQRFGRTHHLVSLCRYAWAIDRLTDADEGPRGLPRADDPLMLSPQVELLAAIHRPKTLVALLSRHGDTLAANRLAGPRVNLLMKAVGKGRKPTTFAIDREVLALLECFRRPQAYAGCRHRLAAAGASLIPSWSDICDLCADGTLTAIAASALAAE